MIKDTFNVCADVARLAKTIPSDKTIQGENLRDLILDRTTRISNLLERVALDPYAGNSQTSKEYICRANRELNTYLSVINGIRNESI